MTLPLLVLPLLAALVSAAALQAGPRTAAAPSAPFQVAATATGGDALTLAFEPGAFDRLAGLHVRGQAFTLERWPLLGGRETRAHLRPVSAFEPGARARIVGADGSESWLAPGVRCFSGWVEGGGELFFGLTRGELHGYFRHGGELFFLSSGGCAPGTAWLARGSSLPRGGAPDFCAVEGGPRAREVEEDPARERLVVPVLKTANVFIEADNVFRTLFPSDQACLDYSALLVTAASEVYRRDMGVRLSIPNGYLRLWNTTPPWGATTSFSDISAVRDWWVSFANPDRNLPRAAVHVFTTPVFGGVANSIGGVCVNQNGYEISSLFGHFPYPRAHTHGDNWDLFVVCHEFGHTFGCQHSFDFQPPIQCQDGSGPDMGTIMSYCHLSFGTGAVGMRFHVREQREIQEHMTFVACFEEQVLTRGDYDADGAIDADDLVAIDAALAQGFRSLGAEEVLDFDGDGGLDTTDRALMAGAIGTPPAQATFRNGRDLNAEFLYITSNPVIGRRWTPYLVGGPVGRPTVLFFYDLPHPGLRTRYGELLVMPVGLGGTEIYTSTAPSLGLQTPHPIDLPANLSLIGFHCTMQGVLVGPPGTELSNAFDLVFGTYE